MTYKIDLSTASSEQIAGALCERLERIRLSRNITQKQLADEAGVSERTIGRLEQGLGVSLDTFIRVLMALRLQHSLEGLLPESSVRPLERVRQRARERQRARPSRVSEPPTTWTWAADEPADD